MQTITDIKVIENDPVDEIAKILERITSKVRSYTVLNLTTFLSIIAASGAVASLVGVVEGFACFSILASFGWLALSFTRRYAAKAKILEKEFRKATALVEKHYSLYPAYEQNQMMLRFLIEFKQGVAAYKL